LGTGVCLIGAGIVALGQPGGLQLGAGAPLVFLAAASAGVSFALQRPLILRNGPLASAQWLLLFGALLLTPWLPQGFAQIAAAPTEATLALVFLGIFPGALAYFTWMIALKTLGAPRAANLLFFMAPIATVMSIPLVGVAPGWLTILGGAVAVGGVFVVHRSRH
jgi:drug/metabolite transporter (DMT)-like permease